MSPGDRAAPRVLLGAPSLLVRCRLFIFLRVCVSKENAALRTHCILYYFDLTKSLFVISREPDKGSTFIVSGLLVPSTERPVTYAACP